MNLPPLQWNIDWQNPYQRIMMKDLTPTQAQKFESIDPDLILHFRFYSPACDFQEILTIAEIDPTDTETNPPKYIKLLHLLFTILRLNAIKAAVQCLQDKSPECYIDVMRQLDIKHRQELL